MPPKLSIVIVNWNVEKLLFKCLQSIFSHQKNPELEVIVVDNASKDQSVEMVRKLFPQVKLIDNKNNVGFAAANNQGAKAGTGEVLLFLNPDTAVFKNTLSESVDFLESNDRIGILGCKHLNPDFTLQPSVRRYPSWLPMLLIFLKIAKLIPNLPPVAKYLAQDFDYKFNQPVDQVAGSYLMMKREIFDAVGGWDENFFTWFEEVDLCRRVKALGQEIWFFAYAEIVHYGGQSFKQQQAVKNQKIFFQSAWYYFTKHGFWSQR